jgi:acetyl-CoA carboxylase biotin carboxyl carrier protein
MTEPLLDPARQPEEIASGMPLTPDDAPPPAPTSVEAPASAAAASMDVVAAADAPAAEPSLADPGDESLLGLVDRLAALLERTELTELEVQVGTTGLLLRKPSAIAPVGPVVAAAAPAAASDAPATASPAAEPAPPARPSVKAPLSGIWYGSPAPGTAPYVSPGGEVAVGQVIGLIEAMKLFNEIKSDLAGRVVKVHAENGKLVRARQPLIEVQPL